MTFRTFSVLINKNKNIPITFFAVAINVIGLLVIAPIKAADVNTESIFNLRIWLGIFLVGVGYVAILQVTKVWTKQLYPKDSKGQFEGIWILFFVLIPMIGGSLIGEAVVKTSGETFLDATSGQTQYIPNGNIFFVGAIVILLTVVPAIFAAKNFKKRIAEGNR